ncbi:DUF5683 domain-containing protein [Cellulophaga baltica]|uniref:DUF5683 domain-containing protein n=1 Tax=Cellulophaga baltica 18 TaxID=1348584 RepID=A0AAU8RFB6_9FLAO|nr:DUF5683 domain-containing protein [Cellulophaga baltica]AIZ42086.1 hypothetical protein M666_11115 [Cellulophaga baltica 18]
MVNKFLFFLLFFVGFTFATQAQDEKPTPKEDTELDSIQTDLKSQGIVVKDSVFKKRVEINPLAPAKAAFYSAIIPGLGQVYNKRYWKVPIVYAALGASIYAYDYNNTQYKRFRTAFKSRQAGFTDDEFYDLAPFSDTELTEPEFSTDALQDAQENFQRDRDLMVLVTIGLYVLNIIDANVDSHLKQFNVDDNLSVDFQPYLDYNEITAQPNYGMALTIKF